MTRPKVLALFDFKAGQIVVANGALAKILWMMDGSYDDGAEYSASCRIRYCGEGPIHCETVLVRDLSRPAAQVTP